MNMFKSNGGFTLVELIVVIAILAILAGVAVPAYSGYIGKANDAADITALSAVKTAAQGAVAETGAVTTINVVATDGVISEINDGKIILYKANGEGTTDDEWNANFKLYMNNDVIELKGSYEDGAVWTSAGWEAKTATALTTATE